MRRRIGLYLVVVGIVATVVGMSSGCGSLFAFNGRHPVFVSALTPGTPFTEVRPGKRGRRYTLAVQVLFDRSGLTERDGALVVEARLPIMATLESARTVGWLDPNEPPTVLYGQSTNPSERRPTGAGPPELVAERLIGPYLATFDQELHVAVDLGPDRLARARVTAVRVVVYDDALPPSVMLALGLGGGGVLTLFAGVIVLLLGFFRSRRGGARRRPTV